ncbi:MAG: hypothetical protein ACO1OB_23355 [Archangium sp.]
MKNTALILAALLCGCEATTYRDFCAQSAKERCTTSFKCDREAAETSWRSLQACIDDLSYAGACREAATQTCELQPELTQRCVSDLQKLSCEERTTQPASCAAVVCLDESKIRCSDAELTFSSMGCERRRTQCTDGNEYRVTCGASKCTCFRGDDEGRDFDRSTFCEEGPDVQDAAFGLRCDYGF